MPIDHRGLDAARVRREAAAMIQGRATVTGRQRFVKLKDIMEVYNRGIIDFREPVVGDFFLTNTSMQRRQYIDGHSSSGGKRLIVL